MINTLQFVVFFTDWDVRIPLNAQLGLKTFRVIALGEFIPTKQIMAPIMNTINPKPDAEDEDGGSADSEDKPSANVLDNMGTMLVILVLLLFVILIAALLVKCCKKDSFLFKKAMAFKVKFFWNGAIRYVLQSYLKTSMGALAATVLINWEGGTNIANSLQAIAMLLVLAQFPFFFMCVMQKNKDNLDSEQMKGKIGTLYLGIKTDSFFQRAYSTIFLSRRFLYAFLTVICRDNPNILIHTFMMSNLMYVVFLGVAEPNDEKLAKRMEFMNESGL